MVQKLCSFVVEGPISFISEFEKILGENKIAHWPQLGAAGICDSFFPTREIVEFTIAVTPSILSIVYEWYARRKKEGTILIQTENGKVKLTASSIRKFEYKEGRTRKSMKSERKKTAQTKRKYAGNSKPSQRKKTTKE